MSGHLLFSYNDNESELVNVCMKFTKMHGIGNDYVYVNCFEEEVREPAKVARFISDRHKGIGADGLILIGPSKQADFKMQIYNPDGSVAEMCGNGIRCAGKYVYEHGLINKKVMRVETLAGIRSLELRGDLISVDMGIPVLDADKIPMITEKTKVIGEKIMINHLDYYITAVSFGNPHVVIFVKHLSGMDLNHIGPAFEYHGRFPKRTNVEVVEVVDRKNIKVRVWERGVGETQACGTGACAAVVASALNDLTEREVEVKLLGGVLCVKWRKSDSVVYMTGPAETVFEGEINESVWTQSFT